VPVAKIPGRVTATHVTEFNPAGDRLHLEQLELDARIGVTDEERAKPQHIVINLTIWPNVGFDQLHDDIERTINYVELCRATREFAQSREWKLIETMASDLSSQLLDGFPIQAVEIEVRKFVLPNTAFVSGTIRRSR
jgi:7,8-dihydroneopterin aldolase/epimerase/oxygenase